MINRWSIRYVTVRLRFSDEHVLKTYSRSNLYSLSFITEFCNITECPWLVNNVFLRSAPLQLKLEACRMLQTTRLPCDV